MKILILISCDFVCFLLYNHHATIRAQYRGSLPHCHVVLSYYLLPRTVQNKIDTFWQYWPQMLLQICDIIMEFLTSTSLGRICLGAGLVMKFGAFSEPDVSLDDDDEEKREIFIGGLPQDVSQDDIHEYFGKFGDIENVRLKMHSMTGRSRGFAFLLYKSKESINNALEYKDHKLKVIK